MKFRKAIIPILSVLSVSLFPIFFMYFNNLGKVLVKEVTGITVVFAFIGLVLLGANYLILKNISKAAVAVNLLMGIFLYFALIENALIKVFPMLYYWHILLICLFVYAHIYYFIHKKMQAPTAYQINQALLIIFIGLISYNAIVKIPASIKNETHKQNTVGQNLPVQSDPVTSAEKKTLPNVYYFIFDEYAGYDGILRYCGFDNIDFYNSLEGLGFVTSKHSINGSVDTYTEIPNLLQLRKVNTVDMSANDKKENFKNPSLFILMKKNGYLINLLDYTNHIFLDDTYADYQFTSEFVSTFRTFDAYIIKNTVYYPFYGSADQDKEINKINKMFDYGSESSTLLKSNLFTVGYFDFPHLPYIVDENGNKTNNLYRSDLSNPVPYLKQFLYTNKKILEMVSDIIKNDPNSIIFLQSDHGYRLPSHLHYWYGIDSYDLTAEAPFEQNILNAVYYQGKVVDIEGLSGMNTLIVVLNQLLGSNMELVK